MKRNTSQSNDVLRQLKKGTLTLPTQHKALLRHYLHDPELVAQFSDTPPAKTLKENLMNIKRIAIVTGAAAFVLATGTVLTIAQAPSSAAMKEIGRAQNAVAQLSQDAYQKISDGLDGKDPSTILKEARDSKTLKSIDCAELSTTVAVPTGPNVAVAPGSTSPAAAIDGTEKPDSCLSFTTDAGETFRIALDANKLPIAFTATN